MNMYFYMHFSYFWCQLIERGEFHRLENSLKSSEDTCIFPSLTSFLFFFQINHRQSQSNYVFRCQDSDRFVKIFGILVHYFFKYFSFGCMKQVLKMSSLKLFKIPLNGINVCTITSASQNFVNEEYMKFQLIILIITELEYLLDSGATDLIAAEDDGNFHEKYSIHAFQRMENFLNGMNSIKTLYCRNSSTATIILTKYCQFNTTNGAISKFHINFDTKYLK